MKTLQLTGVGLCLVGVGCAGPLDRSMDFSFSELQRGQGDRIAQSPVETDVQPAGWYDGLDALTLDDAIRFAMENSPALRGAGFGVDAAAGGVTQAGVYPNPTFVFDGEGLGADAGEGGETVFGIEQEIVLGGRLRHARGVAETDLLVARARSVGAEFSVVSRVTRAYVAAVSARERAARRGELVELADRLMEGAGARVEAGAGTEVDRLRAEVVGEQALMELEASLLVEDAARRTLASVMGLDRPVGIELLTGVGEIGALPSREELVRGVLESNTRMVVARLAVERARRSHELARANAMPELVASVGSRNSDPDDESTIDVGVGIEIPLFDRNQGAIRAALAERMAAGAMVERVRLELLAELDRVWAGYESARLASARYQERLLPKAERTLELTRQAYERGKLGYLRLLDAQQVVVETRIAGVDELQRMHEQGALLIEMAQIRAPRGGSQDRNEEEGS